MSEDFSGATNTEVVAVPKETLDRMNKMIERSESQEQQAKVEADREKVRQENLAEYLKQDKANVVHDVYMKKKIEEDPTILDSLSRLNDHHNFAMSDENVKKALNASGNSQANYQRGGSLRPGIIDGVAESQNLNTANQTASGVDFSKNEELAIMANMTGITGNVN